MHDFNFNPHKAFRFSVYITNKLKNYLIKPFMRAFDKIWLTIKS